MQNNDKKPFGKTCRCLEKLTKFRYLPISIILLYIPFSSFANNSGRLDKQAVYQIIHSKYRTVPSSDIQNIIENVEKNAVRYNLSPEILLAIIEQESNFKKHITSKHGAVGLMQIVPKYHKARINRILKKNNGNIFDIANNIEIGSDLLFELKNKYPLNMRKVLQGYNGNFSNSVYADKILSKSKKFKIYYY